MDDKNITDLLTTLDATAAGNEFHLKFFDLFAGKVMVEQDYGNVFKSARGDGSHQEVISIGVYQGLYRGKEITGALVGRFSSIQTFRILHRKVNTKMGEESEFVLKKRLIAVLEMYLFNYRQVNCLQVTMSNDSSHIAYLCSQCGFEIGSG